MRIITLCAVLFSVFSFGQIPTYYSEIDFTVNGEPLKNQLSELIINTHTTELVYTAGNTSFLDTWTVLKQSDLDPLDSSRVLLMYGWNDNTATFTEHHSRSVNESCHVSSCTGLWVREHVFPKSLGTPNLETEFAGADAHNLRAIDSQRNNSRGNKLFGEHQGSVSSLSLNSTSWYPGDEWIGDVARIIMYMYLRYPTQCNPLSVSTSTSTIAPLGDMPDLFLYWNAIDPPSEFEINRNNAIANAQGNRNPFIDNPYLATLIWNGQEALNTWENLSNSVTQIDAFSVYPTVTQDYLYLNNYSSNGTFAIYNNIGQMVNNGNATESVDVSNLSKGMYFIKYNSGVSSKTIKFIRN